MTNTPLTGNAHFDARIIENSNGWIFSQVQEDKRSSARRKGQVRCGGMAQAVLALRGYAPRLTGGARAIGGFLILLGLGWLSLMIGLTVPWYVSLPFLAVLAGEVLIVVSLIPSFEDRRAGS